MRHPQLKRVLPGFTVSFLGNGMSAVAVSWLAIDLAPENRRGMWVAIAVAAYALPGVCGVVLLAPFMRGRSGAQLVEWDAVLRTVALAAIPAASLLDVLDVKVYVVLLTVSSVLNSWGAAGCYTLVAELLPERDHLPANALVSTLSQFGVLVGPVLAGLVIVWQGAVWAIALDAATFAVLAVCCRLFVPRAERRIGTPHEDDSRIAGLRAILDDRALLGLMALTFGFFLFFGPVEVALPVYVSEDLEAPATVLSWHLGAFGAGAIVGGLLAGYLSRWPQWPTLVASVLGVGVCLLPLGLSVPIAVSVSCFAAVGLLYAPFGSISMAVFQRVTSIELLPQVLAARSALLITATPAGIGLGGVIVASRGASEALLVAAVATLALGVLGAVLVAVRRP